VDSVVDWVGKGGIQAGRRRCSLGGRQRRLQALVSRFDCPGLLHSKAFNDGEALLRVVEKHRLEGVVSKRRSAAYRSGQCRGKETCAGCILTGCVLRRLKVNCRLQARVSGVPCPAQKTKPREKHGARPQGSAACVAPSLGGVI
jgi:hypothetical protein